MEYMEETRGNELLLNGGRRMKKVRNTLITVGVIAAIIILAVVVIVIQSKKIKEMDSRISELINEPAISEPVTPEISLDIINAEIREIGELATMEYIYTNAAKFTDSRQIKDWNIPFTEKSFIIKWDGVIKAGIDVTQITTELDNTNKTIIIYLPEAEILSHDTNEDSVEILDESNGLFNSVSIKDKVQFDAETVKEMEERAIENGLLTKAQENAEEIILKLISAIPGVEEYTIVFEVK